jgi:GT2 family glycosyltransferase
MADLSIVILNWNAAVDTIRCVRSVTAWKQVQPLIIVVDNASTDDSVALIKRECPSVRLIENGTNQGFAGGCNRGIEYALARQTAPILLLNNDALIAEADILRLLDTLQTSAEQIGFIGPLLFDAEQPDRLLAAGSKNPARHHHSHNHELPAGGPTKIVECIPGTAIIIRAELFQTVGLLDEAYFFSSEIVDLCLRARQHGYLGVVDSRARAFHALKRSSGFRAALYPYYIIRNRFLLIRKFHRPWIAAYYGFWTLYALALSLKVRLNGQPALARTVRLGLLDGLRGRFGNQNERVLMIANGTGIEPELAER